MSSSLSYNESDKFYSSNSLWCFNAGFEDWLLVYFSLGFNVPLDLLAAVAWRLLLFWLACLSVSASSYKPLPSKIDINLSIVA